MAYVHKDGSGSSYKNDRKREGKQDADYTGSCMVGGVEYWLDTWIKNNPRKPGYDPEKKTFLSHSFRPKERPQPSRYREESDQQPKREYQLRRPPPALPRQQPEQPKEPEKIDPATGEYTWS